jgi:predicted DNA-binding transcriptional regulator YafY
MANTSSRTLRLLSLLQTHRFWAGPELADRLEVSERTLRRDVERLRELGYPVSPGSGWWSRTGWCRCDGAGT